MEGVLIRGAQRDAPGRRWAGSGEAACRSRVLSQDRPERGRRGIAMKLPGRAIGR